MEKKKQPNVKADANNKNKGTDGTNKILDKNEGNRGKLIQENMQKKAGQPHSPKQQQTPPPKPQPQPQKKQQAQPPKQQQPQAKSQGKKK